MNDFLFTSCFLLRHAFQILCGLLPDDGPGADVDELCGRRAGIQRMACQGLHITAVVLPGLLHRPADIAFNAPPGAAARLCDDGVNFFVDRIDAVCILCHKSDRPNQVRCCAVLPRQTERKQHFGDFVFQSHGDLLIFIPGSLPARAEINIRNFR